MNIKFFLKSKKARGYLLASFFTISTFISGFFLGVLHNQNEKENKQGVHFENTSLTKSRPVSVEWLSIRPSKLAIAKKYRFNNPVLVFREGFPPLDRSSSHFMGTGFINPYQQFHPPKTQLQTVLTNKGKTLFPYYDDYAVFLLPKYPLKPLEICDFRNKKLAKGWNNYEMKRRGAIWASDVGKDLNLQPAVIHSLPLPYSTNSAMDWFYMNIKSLHCNSSQNVTACTNWFSCPEYEQHKPFYKFFFPQKGLNSKAKDESSLQSKVINAKPTTIVF